VLPSVCYFIFLVKVHGTLLPRKWRSYNIFWGGRDVTYTNYKLGVVTFEDKVRAPIGKVVMSFDQFCDFGSISKISWFIHVIKSNFLLTIQSNFIGLFYWCGLQGPKTVMLLVSKALLGLNLMKWPHTNKLVMNYYQKVMKMGVYDHHC
jgi:hypothetical protein